MYPARYVPRVLEGQALLAVVCHGALRVVWAVRFEKHGPRRARPTGRITIRKQLTGDGLDQRRAHGHDASTQTTSLIQSKAERTFRTGLCRPVLTSQVKTTETREYPRHETKLHTDQVFLTGLRSRK